MPGNNPTNDPKRPDSLPQDSGAEEAQVSHPLDAALAAEMARIGELAEQHRPTAEQVQEMLRKTRESEGK